MRVAVAVLLVIAVASGCSGDDRHYSRGDVVHAFRSQGFDLGELTSRLATPTTRVVFKTRAMLAPNSNSGGPFLVLLFKDERRAVFAFNTLTSQATPESFDLRQRNVVVTSDERVPSRVRKRIRAALARLAGWETNEQHRP
jgi:hypothetical protein